MDIGKFKKYGIPAIIAVVVIAVVIIVVSSYGGVDAVESMKEIIYDELGNTTIGKAANENLDNVKWESEQTDDEEYMVSLAGYSTDSMCKLTARFSVTFVDDMVYTSVIDVGVDGESFSDEESIWTVLGMIYGMSVDEAVEHYWSNIYE